ncbi:MAG: hypothetical protein FWE07_02730 [Turicibacter sp.]|nr:hypothetical protein [Turicibacter sp.]
MKIIITLLSLLMLSAFLTGCDFDPPNNNEDSSTETPTIERVVSADDLTIVLSNDSLPPVDGDDIMTYKEAALIGSAMVFDLFEIDFEDKVIVMHYIPIGSMWNNTRGFPYEHSEWLGFIWESEHYSLYLTDSLFHYGEIVSLISFTANTTTGAVTVINKPNKLIHVLFQYNHLIQDFVTSGFVDESLNLSSAEIQLAQERAEYYLAIFTNNTPLTLLYDPVTHPYVTIPIPFLPFIFICDNGDYHGASFHYETLQLIGVSSQRPWSEWVDPDLDDDTNDIYVESCEYDCIIFGDFIQELNLSLGLPIYQAINLLGEPHDAEFFEFNGMEMWAMSWHYFDTTDFFPYLVRLDFEDGYLVNIVGSFPYRTDADWENYSHEIRWGMSSQEAYRLLGLPSIIQYNDADGLGATWLEYGTYSGFGTGIVD